MKKKYGIDVVYDTYDTNETLYSNLKSNAGVYDIVIPSDYMIERLILEDLLQPICKDNIPNYIHINDQYKNQPYDPTDSYSIPYNVGMVGIVYNTNKVDEEDIGSWDLLWNSKYSGQILQFDNPRDGLATAELALGLSLNTSDENELNQVYEKLVAQKPVLQGYVMDQVFQKMESGSAAIATYYAGDCLSMMDENEDLAFYYPTEGTNIFIDAMCIPKCAQNVGAAELFINFMLEPEIAIENALYLYYASPNNAVINSEYYKEELGEDWYDILYNYPDEYYDEDGNLNEEIVQYYRHLPSSTLDTMNKIWTRVKQK